MSGMIPEQPGQCRRGSQEPAPPTVCGTNPATNTWPDLAEALRQAQPALQALRNLLKDPPPGIGYSIIGRLEGNSIPNFVNERRGAQALQAAAMKDLHEGNLPRALEDLTALQGFVRLHADDPMVVPLMIRVAILGLSVDLAWDALQAKEWTEPQLAALQQACEQRALLQQMARMMEAERSMRIYNLNWLRSHSYQEWIARYRPIYRSFGLESPDTQKVATLGLWRQWVFHPVWSFAWSDLEELDYLQRMQQEIAVLRQASSNGSWRKLNQGLAASHRDLLPAFASWRFYMSLPLTEEIADRVGGSQTTKPTSPLPDFSRAWFIALKNLTLHQMVVTALALKRYELRQGRAPATLAALIPEFLPAAPRDFMDGQLLRYQLHGDGSFSLYSIGEDTVDNGGDPLPETANTSGQAASNWLGRDWIWPRPVTPVTMAHASPAQGLP
jgi:hypothetical protein